MARSGTVTAFFLFISIAAMQKAKAQATDSIPKQAAAQETARAVADKFPFTRLLNAEFRYDTPYDYSSKAPGVHLPEGRVTQMYQSRLSTNINFIKSRKWMVSTGLYYNYIHTETEGGIYTGANDAHYFAAGLSVTHFSTLFGKMAIYSATALPSAGNNGFERVTGLASATIVLKATAKTKMTLGAFVILDPTSIVPAALSFSYEHHFDNGWIADVVIPKSIYMKKDMFKDGRLSIGTELDNTMFYINGFNGSKKTYIFNQMEILSGLKYEHCFLKGFIGTIKTGYKYIPVSKVVKMNESLTNYVFKATPNGIFYVNVGLSYNL